MIFVITGTEKYPFDRLIIEVDRLAGADLSGEEIFIQLGSCKYVPRHCKWERYLSFGEMCERVKLSNIIVAHAGAGITLLCIQLGKSPIIVPRMKMYAEHIDNHQISFAKRFEKTGMVTVVNDVESLLSRISLRSTSEIEYSESKSRKNLTDYLESLVVERYVE